MIREVIIIIIRIIESGHRPFLPGTSLEPTVIPHRSGFELHLAVLTVHTAVLSVLQMVKAISQKYQHKEVVTNEVLLK